MNQKLRLSSISAFLAALMVSAVPVTAASWYVDSSAAGSKNGGSWTDAWTSLSAINWSSLSSGDIVWIRGGPYDERILVAKSGTSPQARITLKGVEHPTIRGIEGGTYDNIAVLGFNITQVSSAHNYPAIRLGGAVGWLIQDNRIHNTYGTAIVGRYGTLNSNNTIRSNELDNIGSISQGAGIDAAMVEMYGDSNLIEYNIFGKGLDRIRTFGSGVVVRNNFDSGTNEILFPRSTPYPYHIDFFQSYVSTQLTQKLLIERNFQKDNVSATQNGHFVIIQDGSASGINWVTIRGNVVTRLSETLYLFQNVAQVAIYNNTSNAVQNDATTKWHGAMGFNSPSGGDMFDFRNNTYVNSPNTMDPAGLIPVSYRPTNFTSAHQHRFNTGILPTASGNIAGGANSDPLFNSGTDNFTLQSGSPLRSAGGPITAAVGTGSNSTSLKVSDAKRLFDGWGIAEADTIRIGSGSYVQIASINYSTNLVTLTSARSWADGDAIFVKGSEDVGALPYSFATAFTITNTTAALVSGQNTLSATVDRPDAVRKVEFLVDGIPVGTDYSAPYSISYSSDGSERTVTARAYAAWATQVLVADAVGAGGKAIGGSGSSPVGLLNPPSNVRIN